LSAGEKAPLSFDRQPMKVYRAGATIEAAPGALRHAKLILSGWACREMMLPNGRRQLLSVLLPGDLIGNCSAESALQLADVVAIDSVTVASIEPLMRAVRKDADAFPRIVSGLAELRLSEERRLLDHMVRLGSEPAAQRMADFLLELSQRCRAIGFVTEDSFLMPMTQEMLGDALGLSLVHVNRVLNRLRQANLIKLHGGVLKIQDAIGLASFAGLASADERQAWA